MPKKKKQRESTTSQGLVGSPKKSRNKADPFYAIKRAIRQREAWEQGKNVVLTIPNPNPNETNKRFIRINARDYWGNPKERRGA